MGYLTTFTIYNDGIDLIKDNAQDFADKILEASIGHKTVDVGIGNHCNLIRCQKTRHADSNTVYIHMGNCVFELNAYSEETERLAQRNPKFFQEAVDFLERQIKELKNMTKVGAP